MRRKNYQEYIIHVSPFDTSFLTNNDSTNGPMLAINRKLGYKSEPGIYMLSRDM